MSEKLSEEYSKIIYRIGQEREDKIISGKMKLTVGTIFFYVLSGYKRLAQICREHNVSVFLLTH